MKLKTYLPPKPNRRAKLLPFCQLLIQADAMRLLGQQVFRDAEAAGWIKPRCVRARERGPQKKIYALMDVKAVEERILNGEYPEPAVGPAKR